MVLNNNFKFKLKTSFKNEIIDNNYQYYFKFNLILFDQVIMSQTTDFLVFTSRELDIEFNIKETDLFPMCVLEIEFISDDLSQTPNPVIIKENISLHQITEVGKN
jgi:hypothetical protein